MSWSVLLKISGNWLNILLKYASLAPVVTSGKHPLQGLYYVELPNEDLPILSVLQLVHPFSVSTSERPHHFPHCPCPRWCSAALSLGTTLECIFLSLICKGVIYCPPRLQNGEVTRGSHVKWLTDHWLPQMRRQQLHYLHHSCFVLQPNSHSFSCNKLAKKKHPFTGVTHLYN